MTMYINPLAQHLGTLQHLNHPVDNIGGLMAIDVRKRGHLIGVGSYGPQIYGGAFVGVEQQQPARVGVGGGGQQQPARVGVGGGGVQKIGGGFRRKRKPRKKKSPAVAKSSLKKLKAQKKKCDKELKNMDKMSVKQLKSILKKK